MGKNRGPKGQRLTGKKRLFVGILGTGALALGALFSWITYGFLQTPSEADADFAAGARIGPLFIPLGTDSGDVIWLLLAGFISLVCVVYGVVLIRLAIRGR